MDNEDKDVVLVQHEILHYVGQDLTRGQASTRHPINMGTQEQGKVIMKIIIG